MRRRFAATPKAFNRAQKRAMTPRERIEADSTPEPNTGCWLWTERVDRHGYGKISVQGRWKLAHQVAFQAFGGKIPTGRQLDHKCRQRCCVNPAHLEAVTSAENSRRGAAARRAADRAAQYTAARIRDLAAIGFKQSTIAGWLGVSTGHVSNVLTGKWGAR